MSNTEDSLENLKYLLGNLGLEILLAIDNGARNLETIKLFSGITISCIKGRLPVLLDLNLIKQENEEYILTEKGINLRKELE